MATIGQKELRTSWPFESGLVAGTTSQKGRVMNLVAQEGSIVPLRSRVGF